MGGVGGGSEVLARVRALLDEGRTWQARDLLAAHVEQVRDPEALTLLGHVLHGMGDLPRAGAAWFATGARGPEADEAVAAWREQSGDDFALMWRSLPAPFRSEPRAPRIEALRSRALTQDPGLDDPLPPPVPGSAPADAPGSAPADAPGSAPADAPADALAADSGSAGGGPDGAQVIGWVLGALFVVCAVIGFVTVLGWVIPSG